MRLWERRDVSGASRLVGIGRDAPKAHQGRALVTRWLQCSLNLGAALTTRCTPDPLAHWVASLQPQATQDRTDCSSSEGP